ncbi:hypothetical protein CHLNCDRAFT_141981 [Chlorella variabilis]|uniref:Uncharacterized protein n=1 Tax=Chlorella variabilis TaxID=554065 RepID=E1Z7G6_CHLVA|nr:hypothetical protein CHLNCDRAFT_141981 [Chlorella variabilis]EFN57916.1 hypothetical protein CHLNCDRAFT_141981 [Chlorella variabilis]|eukprot:XP_005850018.1 hypothetical protein CHLNCDRAFT_141981 [Chlorella variabilis]
MPTKLLYEAAGSASAAEFKKLIQQHRILVNAAVEDGELSGRTPLHNAAKSAKSGNIKVLLAAGARVDAADSSGWTALMDAAMAGSEGCVRALLEAGASTAVADECHQTALMAAAFKRSKEGAAVDQAAGEAAAAAPQEEPSAARGEAAAHVFGPDLVWWPNRQEWVDGTIIQCTMPDRVHCVEFEGVGLHWRMQLLRLQHERFQLLGEDGQVQAEYRAGLLVQQEGKQEQAAGDQQQQEQQRGGKRQQQQEQPAAKRQRQVTAAQAAEREYAALQRKAFDAAELGKLVCRYLAPGEKQTEAPLALRSGGALPRERVTRVPPAVQSWGSGMGMSAEALDELWSLLGRHQAGDAEASHRLLFLLRVLECWLTHRGRPQPEVLVRLRRPLGWQPPPLPSVSGVEIVSQGAAGSDKPEPSFSAGAADGEILGVRVAKEDDQRWNVKQEVQHSG